MKRDPRLYTSTRVFDGARQLSAAEAARLKTTYKRTHGQVCKSCGGTGWHTFDLKSDSLHSALLQAGVDCEIACTECSAGRAEIEAAKRATQS